MRYPALAVVCILAAVSVSFVGTAYAYDAFFHADLDSQDIDIEYATLTSDGLKEDVKVQSGTVRFGSSLADSETILYRDSRGCSCYLVIKMTGLGAGNIVTFTCSQGGTEFSGSATVDASGTAQVHGIGLIQPGTFTISGVVAGSVANPVSQTLTIAAYPV